jgi:two-component system cell cycle response regulator DivK
MLRDLCSDGSPRSVSIGILHAPMKAAKILLLDSETRNIPIVFVTASVLAEGIEEIKSIPNAVFIGKPINTRTFAKEVGQFIK